jgi:ribosome-associated toxin RatA of RatAB toxin-antitoxin module
MIHCLTVCHFFKSKFQISPGELSVLVEELETYFFFLPWCALTNIGQLYNPVPEEYPTSLH